MRRISVQAKRIYGGRRHGCHLAASDPRSNTRLDCIRAGRWPKPKGRNSSDDTARAMSKDVNSIWAEPAAADAKGSPFPALGRVASSPAYLVDLPPQHNRR